MNKAQLITGIFCLCAGLAGGYLISGGNAVDMPAPGDDPQPLFYRNPMNPEITSPVPAQDSMGMDYIPVYAQDETPAVEGTVKISPVVQHNIGVRTARAERRSFGRTIRTVGRVDYDEEKIVHLHPKIEGWISDMRIDKTGQPVVADDILLSVYSPKLVATQQEYLLARSNLDELGDGEFDAIREGAQALVASSRERLELLDVPEHQIRELEESGEIKESIHIHAPAGGTVLHIGARQGQYVTPATELYMIVDLATVWVYADVYEYELPWVKQGDRVKMTLASAPGRVFEGELAYIYPYAESNTRTTRVRLVFDNPDMLLRPEMFAEVVISADEKPDQVVVPAEAVVRSGDYEQVFVEVAAGTFEPRRVSLGVESGGMASITGGLQAGEVVVVSAQFLIDSESKLREATAKMQSMAGPGSRYDGPLRCHGVERGRTA